MQPSHSEVGLCDEAPIAEIHKWPLAGKMVWRCELGWADAYKSPMGKGFLMQHSVLAASIFCHSTVKDERPGGNTSPQDALSRAVGHAVCLSMDKYINACSDATLGINTAVK